MLIQNYNSILVIHIDQIIDWETSNLNPLYQGVTLSIDSSNGHNQ